MEDGNGGGEAGTSAGRFPILQANRDPESNWEVDVAKSLEEYLLKICSGEISGDDEAHNFNFAEAALLLQGSVQVYSRKVEYLYSLVLHALEFLSQNKQDQQEKGSAETNENDPNTTVNKEDDMFAGLDDVPAESKTTLDNNLDRDDLRRKIVRPPANLLVFEGDGVDSEASELDSYLGSVWFHRLRGHGLASQLAQLGLATFGLAICLVRLFCFCWQVRSASHLDGLIRFAFEGKH